FHQVRYRPYEEVDRIREHRFVRAAESGQVDGEYPEMRGERLEIVIELARRRAAEPVDKQQRRATATAQVVQIDSVDGHGLACERGKRLGHEVRLSASALRGAGRDRS